MGVKWGFCGRGFGVEEGEWCERIGGARGMEGFVWGKMIGIFYN